MQGSVPPLALPTPKAGGSLQVLGLHFRLAGVRLPASSHVKVSLPVLALNPEAHFTEHDWPERSVPFSSHGLSPPQVYSLPNGGNGQATRLHDKLGFCVSPVCEQLKTEEPPLLLYPDLQPTSHDSPGLSVAPWVQAWAPVPCTPKSKWSGTTQEMAEHLNEGPVAWSWHVNDGEPPACL